MTLYDVYSLAYKRNHSLKLDANGIIKLAEDMFNAKDPTQIDKAYSNLGNIINGIKSTDFLQE